MAPLHTIHDSQLSASFVPFDPAYKNENIWEVQGRVGGETISRTLSLSQPHNFLLLHRSSSSPPPTTILLLTQVLWETSCVEGFTFLWMMIVSVKCLAGTIGPLPRTPSHYPLPFPPLAQYGASSRLTTAKASGSFLYFCFPSIAHSPEKSGDGSQVATMQQDSETKR